MSWQEYEEVCARKLGQNSHEIGAEAAKVGFDHPKFDEVREKMREEQAFIDNPIQVEEGVMQCGKCKSFKTYCYQKQMRGSDEGFSTFASCFNCGAQWREN